MIYEYTSTILMVDVTTMYMQLLFLGVIHIKLV